MTASSQPIPPRLPALFRLLWQQTYPEILRRVADAGFSDIRPSHWPVIQWPGPEGARPSTLAERARMSKQAINHVLRDLERLGYITLRPDPSDNRARLVHLTARGRRLERAMFEAAADTERAIEDKLTPGQRRNLKATLTALWRADGSPRHGSRRGASPSGVPPRVAKE
jgi:DNA-binding MarR family transcriptional regulator